MGLFNDEPQKPVTVHVEGYQLKCPVCQGTLFTQRKYYQDAAFGKLQRRSYRRVQGFICSTCSYLMMFDNTK